MNCKVSVTGDLDTTWDEIAITPLDAPNAKMFGNTTFDEVSIGTFEASQVDNPTERLAFLCDATFVKPIIEHDIVNGPEAIVVDPDSVITRRGSVTELTNVAVPEACCEHLTSSIAV